MTTLQGPAETARSGHSRHAPADATVISRHLRATDDQKAWLNVYSTIVDGFAPKVMQFISAKLCISAASALNVAAIMVNAESTETQSSQSRVQSYSKTLLGQGDRGSIFKLVHEGIAEYRRVRRGPVVDNA